MYATYFYSLKLGHRVEYILSVERKKYSFYLAFFNFCKIDKEIIDCLLEYGSLKIGTYSPGMHISIKDESILFEEPQPTHALVLAWNIKDIIIPKLREKGFNGKFIIPVPTPYIL